MNQFQLAANEQKIKSQVLKKKVQVKKQTPKKIKPKTVRKNKCQSWITACQYIMLTSILCISIMIVVLVHK